MRPRRRVAIYSQNERASAALTYLLRLRLHITITQCSTAAEAATAGCELTILLLNDREEKAGLQALCQQLKGASLLCDLKRVSSEDECAATAYLPGPLDSALVLDRARALLLRRRGPKPQAVQKSAAAAAAG